MNRNNVSKKLLGVLLLAGGLAGSVAAHALTVDVGGKTYTLSDTGATTASATLSSGSSHTIQTYGQDFGGSGVGTSGIVGSGFQNGSYVGDFTGYYDLGVNSSDALNAAFTAQLVSHDGQTAGYPSGSTIEFLLFTDADSSASSYSLTSGSLVGSFSLADALSGITQQLQAGADYLLAVVFNSNGNGGDFSFDATVTNTPVSTTPIPGAIWLFGTALLGFVGFSNRRKV